MKPAQSEELQLLGGFLAASQDAQVIELPPDGSLPEILGITEERKVTFSEKRGDHAGDQNQQQPGRKVNDGDRQRKRRDHLLHQPPDGLNHPKPVGRLHAGALEPVIKHRVFVGNHVQLRGVPHHGNADVAGVLVSQQRVQVIEHAGDHAGRHRQRELRRHQPPESLGYRLMMGDDVDNAVDNQLADASRAIGSRALKTRTMMPKVTTAGPDSHTILRTGGIWPSAARRSCHPLQKLFLPCAIDPFWLAGEKVGDGHSSAAMARAVLVADTSYQQMQKTGVKVCARLSGSRPGKFAAYASGCHPERSEGSMHYASYNCLVH